MTDRRILPGLVALFGVLVASAVLAFNLTGSAGTTAPAAPAAAGAEFVVECTWSHRAADDPIVHPGHAGASHMHDFFGSSETDATSVAASLLGSDSSCQTHPGDTAAYWGPTLYDGDDPVDPGRLFAYYRLGRDASTDPNLVSPYPLGLAMVAGDMSATEPQSLSVVAWHCGASSVVSAHPPSCPRTAPLTLRVVFPSCWDGERLDSGDHRSHVAYADAQGCPATHPTTLPELVLDVSYAFAGDPANLRLASGEIITAHADFLNAWDPDALARNVESCLRRGIDCGVAARRSSD
jgi:hypothetical protein